MLESTVEQLNSALAELEFLELKDRSLLLDTKAQGLELLSMVNAVMEFSEGENQPSNQFVNSVRQTVKDYLRVVRLLQDDRLKNR